MLDSKPDGPNIHDRNHETHTIELDGAFCFYGEGHFTVESDTSGLNEDVGLPGNLVEVFFLGAYDDANKWRDAAFFTDLFGGEAISGLEQQVAEHEFARLRG